MHVIYCFFFKHETAYEMRISDWSSDVCSSDLLNPETSDSYSAGFVWSPGFASNTWWSERVDYEVTWYRHELSGAIQAIDAQTQLDLCVETLDPEFCNKSEERRVGKECVSTCRSRWSPNH